MRTCTRCLWVHAMYDRPKDFMGRTEDEARVETLRDKAADMELRSVDFLDRNGVMTPNRNAYTTIRMTFVDGVVITLPRRLEHFFSSQTFKLRPAQDDA